MSRITLREWPSECGCGFVGKIRGWSNEFPLPCPTCGAPTDLVDDRPKYSPMIATDSLVGGLEVPHGKGIINPDGSPKKYYSKTDLYRALNENGWNIVGDTPKEYKVHWSGKMKSNGGLPVKNED